jgi:hypothetical protein
MNSNIYNEKQQQAIHLQSRIDSFFDNFTIGTLLNRCGIRKMRGISPLQLVKAVFSLPFEGRSFFHQFVKGKHKPFKKDSVYSMLRNPHYNWRRLLILLAARMISVFDLLTDNPKRKVLVIDDSVYDRSHSKFVELLARVYDHCDHRFVKGFKMLTIGWTDGASFLPLDFALLSSQTTENRMNSIEKKMDKRSCGYRRRKEALNKSTELLEPMVKRVLASGVDASYILMDSWLAFPNIIETLHQHRPVICMLKDLPTIQYCHQNVFLCLGDIYRRVRKRPGKAKIVASTIVTLKSGMPVKIVFVRNRNTRGWLALLSTDLKMSAEEIVQTYGKRWNIEVFFKMAKHYLKLEKEMQMRDYDGLISHTTIVMIRYLFLAFEQRLHDDHRTLGSLFHACIEEVKDITLLESLQRILTLAVEKVSKSGAFAESVIRKIIDAVMDVAVAMLNQSTVDSKLTPV